MREVGWDSCQQRRVAMGVLVEFDNGRSEGGGGRLVVPVPVFAFAGVGHVLPVILAFAAVDLVLPVFAC